MFSIVTPSCVFVHVELYCVLKPDAPASLLPVQVKRGMLNELVEYISVNRGVITEALYPEGLCWRLK